MTTSLDNFSSDAVPLPVPAGVEVGRHHNPRGGRRTVPRLALRFTHGRRWEAAYVVWPYCYRTASRHDGSSKVFDRTSLGWKCKPLLSHHLLELEVLLLKLAQALRVRNIHAAVLCAPLVEGGVGDVSQSPAYRPLPGAQSQ